MRRAWVLICAVTFLVGSVNANQERPRRVDLAANKTAAAPRAFTSLPFAPGENLSYAVDWNGYVTAAKVELAVVDRGNFFGQEGLHLSADIRTVGLVRQLFAAIDNRYQSYANPATVLPFRYERNTKVNQRSDSGSVLFDRRKLLATVDGTSTQIGPETGDALSLFYRVRALPLQPGDAFVLDGFEKSRRVEMRCKVEARERVQTGLGSAAAVRVAFVPVRNGTPDDTDRIRVWFADDFTHLPVLVTASPEFGDVRMTLTGAKGVKGG
jgi:hypothetical protein